jgi:glycerol-3-phosphate acyltransferase PlsY
MNLLPWLVIPGAYLLGGVSPGYWLVRMRTGTDVRTQGSGATGATNAARSLGTQGFVMVMLLDTLKGAAAAALARPAGLSAGWEFAAAAAVVAGHIWPVQLGFRGGRGFSPLLGAWLVLAPLAIGICLVIAGITWSISRQRVWSALFGALLLPATTWWVTRSLPSAGFSGMAFGMVALAHRSHWMGPGPRGPMSQGGE